MFQLLSVPLLVVQLAVVISLSIGTPINYFVAKWFVSQDHHEDAKTSAKRDNAEDFKEQVLDNKWELDVSRPRAFYYVDEFVLKPMLIRDYHNRKKDIYKKKAEFERDEGMYKHGDHHGAHHDHDSSEESGDHGHGGGHAGHTSSIHNHGHVHYGNIQSKSSLIRETNELPTDTQSEIFEIKDFDSSILNQKGKNSVSEVTINDNDSPATSFHNEQIPNPVKSTKNSQLSSKLNAHKL